MIRVSDQRPFSFESLERRSLMSAVEFNSTFGTGVDGALLPGTVTGVFGTPDEKILIAFGTLGGNHTFTLQRLNADGTPDATFGTGGFHSETLPFDSLDSVSSLLVNDVAFYSNGRFVVVGQFDTQTTLIPNQPVSHDTFIARFNADGTFDNTFSDDGFASFDAGGNDTADRVAIDGSGRIVVGAHRFLGDPGAETPTDAYLLRYSNDGILDGSFGGFLVTTAVASSEFDVLTDLAIQDDGKIVYAGYGSDSNLGVTVAAVGRIGDAGNVDTSFGAGGVVVLDSLLVGVNARAAQLALSGSSILVAGSPDYLTPFVVRLDGATGAVDTSFGQNGAIVGGSVQRFELFRSDGRILLVSQVGPLSGDASQLRLNRFNNDGTPDIAFGDDPERRGEANVLLGHQTAGVISLANGKFLAWGIEGNSVEFSSLTAEAPTPTPPAPPPIEPPVKSFAKLSGGKLTIKGTDADDVVRVSLVGTTLTATLNGFSQIFNSAAVRKLNIDVRKGNDNVVVENALLISEQSLDQDPANHHLAVTLPTTIKGGAGNDTITTGDGATTVEAGDGDDVVTGADANDRLKGDKGNDILDGGFGDDRLEGGDGNDRLSGNVGNDSLKGDKGNDTLLGNAGADHLDGGKGDDILAGATFTFAAHDPLEDTVIGGPGTDSVASDVLDLFNTIERILQPPV